MKKRFILTFSIFALLVSFTAFSQAVNAQKKPSKKDQQLALSYRSAGDRAYKSNDFRTAITNYAQAIVIIPSDPEPHFWKANAHHRLKENDIALVEFDNALAKGYKADAIYSIRWRIYYDRKEYPLALSDVQSALKDDPKNVEFLTGLADIYLVNSQFPEALKTYKRVAELSPKNGDISYKIAEMSFKMGDTASQGPAAEEAIKRRTRFLGDSYALLADYYQKTNKTDEAIVAFDKALSANPKNYTAYKSLADLHRSQNNYSKAIEVMRSGLRTFPNDGSFYTDLGWYYSMSDRTNEAVEASKAAIHFAPDQFMGYTNLCRAYNDTNKPLLAINECTKALKISPNDGETLFYMGRAHALAGKNADSARYYSRSIEGLEKFAQANPRFSDAFYILGNAYLATQQPDKAVAAYERTLRLSPNYSKAMFNLGVAHVNLGNKAKAEEQYQHLVALNNKNATEYADNLKSFIANMK